MQDMAITDEPISNIVPTKEKHTTPMMTIIDSFDSFKHIEEKLHYDNVKFRQFHLIVLIK